MAENTTIAWTDHTFHDTPNLEQIDLSKWFYESRQPRVGDLPAAQQSRLGKKIQAERHGKTESGTHSGDSGEAGSGGKTQDHRSGFRNDRQEHIADLSRSSVGIHWVIFGGESGPGARPCNVNWIRDGVRQCRAAGVAPFVKQLGAHTVAPNGEWPVSWIRRDCKTGLITFRLKDKKGGDPSEWPEDLRVREFPTSTEVHAK